MTDWQHHHLDRATQRRKVGEGAMDEDMDGEHHQHHHLRRCWHWQVHFFSYFLIFITNMYYYSLYIFPCPFQPQHVMSTCWGLPFAFDSGHNDPQWVITTRWGVFLQYPPPTMKPTPPMSHYNSLGAFLWSSPPKTAPTTPACHFDTLGAFSCLGLRQQLPLMSRWGLLEGTNRLWRGKWAISEFYYYYLCLLYLLTI